MLTVHHLNNSRSQRVLWLLEELGVPYEIVRYQRQPDMRAPAELRAIHPLGKSPVITDNGNTIAESGAIAEYIIDTYGKGRLIPPPNTPERLRYTYWLHYAEGSAMSPLLLKLLFTLMPKRAPALLRPLVRKVSNQALTTLVNPQLKQHMEYWEGELGKSEWFAGNEFTAADIQMSFPLEAAAARGGLEQGHPKAMAFLERIHARPAYARALEKGGPYAGRAVDVYGCAAAITSFTSRAEPADIAGRIDAVAEAHHDQMLRRHDHDALAEIAGGKERVAGNAEPDAAFGVWMLAAIGPEAGAIVGVERRGGREIHPVLVQDALAADHAVIEIEQSEPRPVPRARQHVGRSLQRADAVEFQRDVAHAERIEQFAPGKGQRLLRSADGVADDPRQQLRGGAANRPSACPAARSSRR